MTLPQIVALDIPFEDRYMARNTNVHYDKRNKLTYYEGDITAIPAQLKPYIASDYSYTRWLQDQFNGSIQPAQLSHTVFTPQPHQLVGANAIAHTYARKTRGFILADGTGVGKTLTMVAGLCSIARLKKKTSKRPLKVCVVCPKSAMATWRYTLHSYPQSTSLRVMLMTYHSVANKLLTKPATAKSAKTTRTAHKRTARLGTPKINFDVIIFDEAHYLKNYGSSNIAYAGVSLAGLNKPYTQGVSPFVIFASATPASTPLHWASMSSLLAPLINPRIRKTITPDMWGSFLFDEGFHVAKTKSGWVWNRPKSWGTESAEDKAIRDNNAREDTTRIMKALSSPNAPYLMREPTDLNGWKSQPIEPYYIELSSTEQELYNQAWLEFRNHLNLARKGQSNPQDSLVQRLRFRQKASYIKAPYIAEHIAELIEEGNQVFVGCEFLETIDIIGSCLDKNHIPYSRITGQTLDREEQRLAFQKGHTQVLLCNITEALSAHAQETLPDGSYATPNPRVTIIADVRQNPNDCVQQMGRAHRNGQVSPCQFPLIIGTVDEVVMSDFIYKAKNMKTMRLESSADYLDIVFSQLLSKA